MKKLIALLGVALIGTLAWIAAGPDEVADVPVRRDVSRAMGKAPPASATSTPVGVPDLPGEPLDVPPPEVMPEPPVPAEVIAPIATETAAPPVAANETPSMRDADAPRAMIIPVAGVGRSAIRDMFNESRGNRRHEAIDILAPTGTPVIATDDGVVKKLFTSKPGGLTVYQFDPDQRFCYYYAHLDRYAPGLHEGQLLRRGEVLGYVGTTGNAGNTPHLHFALIRLDKEPRWWKGTYVNPYPLLAGR
ncbi:MAG TPA: M23 family metallopeptidase [Thermoanaerobaculia bacterium]|nr:M23 family metallopeptidase [Thermoanaerobaculia bacterium]